MMSRHLASFILLAAFFLSACQGKTSLAPPASTSSPSPTNTPEPTATSTLRSGNGVKKVTLIFVNQAPMTIRLKWVNSDGVEDESFTEVPPISFISVSSYDTYAWRVYDRVERLLGEVVATADEVQAYQIKNTRTLVVVPPVPVAALGERSYFDRPDDVVGKYQIHVIYALFSDDQDRQRDLDGSINNSIKLANKWLKEQTGGSSLRFDTYQGELDVTFLQFDKSGKEVLDGYQEQFKKENINATMRIEDYYYYYLERNITQRLSFESGKFFLQKGKYYILYVEKEHPNNCGVSRYAGFPGVFYLGTQDCGYGKLGAGEEAWSTEFLMLHETLHGIGFAPACAPHNLAKNPHHVTDSNLDLMAPYAYKFGTQQVVLDVGHDDYFNANIPGCPDLSNSAFLDPLPVKPEPPRDWSDAWKLP